MTEGVPGVGDDRLSVGRRQLESAIATVREVCEPVNPPKIARDYVNYFCARNPDNVEMVKKHEPRRRRFYEAVDAYVAAYSAIASEMGAAAYLPQVAASIEKEVHFFEKVRDEVARVSGDSAA
jgi:type I restriction enzyme R subunit